MLFSPLKSVTCQLFSPSKRYLSVVSLVNILSSNFEQLQEKSLKNCDSFLLPPMYIDYYLNFSHFKVFRELNVIVVTLIESSC